MKGKEKRISLLVIVVLFVAALVWTGLPKNEIQFPPVLPPTDEKTTDLSSKAILAGKDFDPTVNPAATGWTNYKEKKLEIDLDFTTHLPIVVIDTNGQKPERGVVWDSEKEYYVPTGQDPYAYGEISVIDSKDGLNCLNQMPQVQSLCKLKVRGNSSGNYDKKQYLIKLTDENGKPESASMLGMGSDSEWILNVSFIDKSLLRNYLAYMAGGTFMPYTPDVKFCEVVWKEGNRYFYEGIYLMIESVKVSKYRVDLPRYTENGNISPALLRRDRYNVNGVMLENYATQKGLTSGYLDVEYPSKSQLTEKGIDNITQQINRFETALYADSWEEFVKYRQYVNLDSFVDYFIINEFFLNYDAGYNSTYIYMDYSGKLSMGPIWDFDQAMDNNATVSANFYTTAFHSAPWFDKLLQDPVFTQKIIQRYAQLRKSILSDDSIQTFVHKTVEWLQPAIERDWARWGYYYTDGNYLQSEYAGQPNRNTQTHTEEVERILDALSKHGAWMDERLDSLYQFKSVSLEDAEKKHSTAKKDYGQALAVVFVAVFFVSVNLVLKHESE